MGKKSKKGKNSNNTDNSNIETVENIIDFYKGYSPNPEKKIPFPAPYKSEPRIYFEEEVFKEIQEHSTQTTDVELCGVLIGEVRFDVSGNYLYICGSIRGEYARNSGVNVSFTSETWDYIHKVKDEKYSDYSIIGWYHTHPGFGIFLSDMDKFIQDNFFNLPFQIALVVDPKASQNGIFTWQDNKIVPLKNCWIGKEQLSLTIGTVGGEETYKGDIEPDYTNKDFSSVPTSDSSAENESNINIISNEQKGKKIDNSFYKHAFYYFLCFNIAFLLTNFIHLKIMSNSATTALQIEAKNIIASWVVYQSVSNNLEKITNSLDQTILLLDKAPATSTYSVDTLKQYFIGLNHSITKVLKDSEYKRDYAIQTLDKIASKNLSLNENLEKNTNNIKHLLADSLLIQLEPYLTSLSANPSINESRIKAAKEVLEDILSICSEKGKNRIKQEYDWILQTK